MHYSYWPSMVDLALNELNDRRQKRKAADELEMRKIKRRLDKEAKGSAPPAMDTPAIIAHPDGCLYDEDEQHLMEIAEDASEDDNHVDLDEFDRLMAAADEDDAEAVEDGPVAEEGPGVEEGIPAKSEEDTGKILGAHMLGHGAEEVIHLFSLAISHGITAEELAGRVYAYPTFTSDLKFLV